MAVYKSLAVLLVTCLTWYILKAVLRIIDRRLQKFPFFQDNPQTIHSVRRILFYALIAIALTYATRLFGSWASSASRMASETWSATLSGWPIETDSEVKSGRAMFSRMDCG